MTDSRPKSQQTSEQTQQQKAAECSQMMARLGLVLDKQHVFNRLVLQLRRESDMHPVWTKRGMNAETLLGDMHRWLSGKVKKTDK